MSTLSEMGAEAPGGDVGGCDAILTAELSPIHDNGRR